MRRTGEALLKRTCRLTFWLTPWFVAALVAPAAAKSLEVRVAAGDFDRYDTPLQVTFEGRPGVGGAWELVDDSGTVLPLQMRDENHGQFILPELKAKRVRTYKLREASSDVRPRSGVEATKQGRTIAVTVGGKPVFTYQGGKTEPPVGYPASYKRGGYIYPLLTPSGKNVADDYPPNHKHHHGIWAAWTKTEFEERHPDFWNMGDKTGTVEPVDFGQEFSGPVCGGFTATHRYVDLSARPSKDALNETWQVTVYRLLGDRQRPRFVFDLTVIQFCAGSSPLTLEQYRYGGVAFRGSREWNGKHTCEWLTSEGKDRIDGNESRSRWVRVSGEVGGQQASVAILDSPDNFRFPQPIRIFPDQPYCVYSPSQLGEFQITPAKPFVERYRFVVCDGVMDKSELDRLWNDYAHPPAVQIR